MIFENGRFLCIDSNVKKSNLLAFVNVSDFVAVGLIRTVVSISHCGCDDPGSIPGWDIQQTFLKYLSCTLFAQNTMTDPVL